MFPQHIAERSFTHALYTLFFMFLVVPLFFQNFANLELLAVARAILFCTSVAMLPLDDIQFPRYTISVAISSGLPSRYITAGSVRANMHLVLISLTIRPTSFAAATTLFSRDWASSALSSSKQMSSA